MSATGDKKRTYFVIEAETPEEAETVRKRLKTANIKYSEKDACRIAYIISVSEGKPRPISFD